MASYIELSPVGPLHILDPHRLPYTYCGRDAQGRQILFAVDLSRKICQWCAQTRESRIRGSLHYEPATTAEDMQQTSVLERDQWANRATGYADSAKGS